MDLSTKYLGMKLRTPLVASASPLSHEISGIRRLEDAGASAVVLYSLFEEQLHKEALELELHLNAGTESFAESLTYFPHSCEFNTGPEEYLEPHPQSEGGGAIFRSSPASTVRPWADGRDTPSRSSKPGADAIECNIYFIPTNTEIPGPRSRRPIPIFSAR